ncbi:MAG: methyltransferase domain-containing protein [Chlamydiae bacterium]|nr:methyltransferase domain-containing protein [Chlamydiota bacterium]
MQLIITIKFTFITQMHTDRESLIRSVFNKIPNYYDIMNDAMSFGMHRIWKKQLAKEVKVVENGSYLDLSTGSGDIALLLLKKLRFFNTKMTCADPDSDMLIKAKEKLLNNGFVDIDFKETAAEKMDFDDNFFDITTVSFGLRNVFFIA